MKKQTQKILLRLAILPLFLFGLSACDSDSGSSKSPSNAAGKWKGSGAYEQGTVISNFQMDLSQEDKTVSGTYSITRTGRDTMNGTVTGTITGNHVGITMNPHGYADGSADGNAMSLFWYESGFGGTGGGGTVNLTR